MQRDPGAYQKAVLAKLEATTGQPMSYWLDLVASSGLAGFMERVGWLKQTHGLPHTQAYLVVQQLADREAGGPASPDELLQAQYAGAKAGLLPLYERLAQALQSLGPDVRLEVRKTYVAAVRDRQFAVLQPTAKTTLTLGLVLPGVSPQGRLEAARSVGSGRTTHQIRLSQPSEVDQEVTGWARRAYDLS